MAMQPNKTSLDKVEMSSPPPFTRIVRRYTKYVVSRPWHMSLLPALLMGVLSWGLLTMEEVNDVRYQFTPENSESISEYRIANEFQTGRNSKSKLAILFILVLAKDKNSSILTDDNARRVIRLVDYITDEFASDGISYHDFCSGTACNVNDPLRSFLHLRRSLTEEEWRYSPIVRMTYPIIRTPVDHFNIASHLFDVATHPDSGIINYARMAMIYVIASLNGTRAASDGFEDWQTSLLSSLDANFGQSLTVLSSSDAIVAEAVRMTGSTVGPFLALAWSAVFVFTIISTGAYRRYVNQLKSINLLRSTCDLVLVLVGCLCPALGACAAFGLLATCGVHYQMIVSASLVLIMAVGVDDVFIMMHMWQRRANDGLSIESRLCTTLLASLPSMSITSLTNALSFAIGLSSNTPAIRIFCVYTMTAIVAAYACHVTIFVAAFALCAKWAEGERESKEENTSSNDGDQKVGCFVGILTQCAVWATSLQDKIYAGGVEEVNIMAAWSTLLTKRRTKRICLLLMAVHVLCALFGLSRLSTDINVNKLLLPAAPLRQFNNLFEEHVLGHMEVMHVYVKRTPDLRKRHNVRRILQFAHDLENAEGAYGRESTQLWLREYVKHMANVREIGVFDYSLLPAWLGGSGLKFRQSVHTNDHLCHSNHPSCIEEFHFSTAFTNITTFGYRVHVVQSTRDIVNVKYAALEASLFEEHNFYADQMVAIVENTKQSVLVGLFAMTVICWLAMRAAHPVISASLTVLSVNLGVFGYLCLWGVKLDPLTMAALLMSIGFSVDFTAHIAYHYFNERAREKSQHKALTKCYSSMAKPMIQSAITTLLAGVIPVLHGSHLTVIFAKTITLVVLLGLAHALFVLPVVMMAMEDVQMAIDGWRVREEDKETGECKTEDIFNVTPPSSHVIPRPVVTLSGTDFQM